MNDASGPADPGSTRSRLQNLTTRYLSLAAIQSDRVVNEELARAGARKWHYAVLATLEEAGAASQADLSRRTRIYRSDVVAVVNELVDSGLVERSPNPADRRQNIIALTERGRQQLLRLDRLLVDVEDMVLAPLTQPERAQLARLLTVLVDHHATSM
jgi:DNA-binding MarR family transcriptional regulator